MSLEALAMVLGGEPLCMADAGAANYLPDTWNYLVPMPSVKFVLVDPVGQTLAYAKQFPPHRMTVVPTALSRRGGAAEFFLANASTGSSLLPPHPWPGRQRLDLPYFFPLRILDIPTTTLEACLDEAGVGEIHAIKLDTQGSELDIVKGLDRRRLEALHLVEMEVSLYERPLYLGAAKLPEVIDWFEERGFRFINIRANREELDKAGCTGPQYASTIPGQYECDVLFVRDIFQSGPAGAREFLPVLRRHLALLCAYYLHGEAIEVLRQAGERFAYDPGLMSSLEDAIRRFAGYQTEALKQGILSLWHRDKG